MSRPGIISTEAWRYFLQFFRGSWLTLVLTSVGSLFPAMLMIPMLFLVKYSFDTAIPGKQISTLVWIGAAIVGIRLLNSAITLILRNINIRLMTTVVYRLRENLMQRVYGFSRGFYATEDQRVLQARIVQDTERIANLCNSLISGVIPAVLVSAGLIAILLILNWALFLVIALFFPLIFLANWYFARNAKREVHAFQRSFEGFSKVTSFVMKFMDLIKIQSTENLERRKQSAILEDLRDKTSSMTYAFSLSGQVQTFLIGAAGIVVMVLGGISVVKGMMTLGDFFVFYLAANQLQNNFNAINGSFSTIITGNESLVTIHKLASHHDVDPYNGETLAVFNKAITLSSVSFRYDEKPVLTNVNMEIVRGKSMAIIGANGAGKSTLINLVLGFYKPESGSINLDGIPYSDIDFHHFRRSIGVVLQHPPLIPGTIRENIRYGNESRSDDEILQVSKLSLAYEFIRLLPDVFDTQIGEDGVLLSGGERQMVAIARALLRRPALLILDEPTNHLDGEAVGKIMQNLKEIDYKPAILLISHNMEVVSFAEEVRMLEHGMLHPFNLNHTT